MLSIPKVKININKEAVKLLHKLVFIYPELEHCIFTNGNYIDISPPTLRSTINIIKLLRNTGHTYEDEKHNIFRTKHSMHYYIAISIFKDTHINILTSLGEPDINADTQITLKEINENITD